MREGKQKKLVLAHVIVNSIRNIFEFFNDQTKGNIYMLMVSEMNIYASFSADHFVIDGLSNPKDVKEPSWMSHRVIRSWFLLNFVFISVFLDILVSLSISRALSSGFSGRQKSSCLDIPSTIIKCDYIN